jgi:hypothetical protein
MSAFHGFRAIEAVEKRLFPKEFQYSIAAGDSFVLTGPISEVFLGLTVIALGESLAKMARLVAPARHGHPELAWGNVWAPLSSSSA